MSTATEFLSTSVKLAKGGFTTTEGAVDLLTTTLNAYGLETSEATKVSDMLIMTQNKGKTTIDELSSSLGRVLPTASAYNVKLQDVSTSMALMTAGGIATAESSTYLKSMLNELAKEGSTVSDILKSKTKKSFSQLMDSGYSLGDVMKILGDSVKNDATAFANLWSSQEAGAGALTILNNGTKAYNETLKEIAGTTGATENAYSKMSNTFETKWAKMKESLNNLAITIGEKVLPLATDLIEKITEKISTTDWDSLSKTLKTIGAVLTPLVTAIATIWGYFKMVSIIKKLQTAFATLNAVMSANPILLIVSLITALVAGFIYLWNTSEDFRNFWIGLWNGIKSVFEAVWNAISTFFTETIPSWFNNFIAFCQGFWQGLTDTFKNAWNSIVAFFTETIPQWIQSIIDWFANLPYQIGYQIGQILASITQFGLNVWNWVTTELPKIIQEIIKWFAELPGNIWNWLVNVINDIGKWGQEMWNKAISAVSNMINNVINWFAQLPRKNLDLVS